MGWDLFLGKNIREESLVLKRIMLDIFYVFCFEVEELFNELVKLKKCLIIFYKGKSLKS